MRPLFAVVAALLLSACATKLDRAPAGPPAYREGYTSGCDSGYAAAGNIYYRFNKDPERALTDAMYASGWSDGFAVCKGKYDNIVRTPY